MKFLSPFACFCKHLMLINGFFELYPCLHWKLGSYYKRFWIFDFLIMCYFYIPSFLQVFLVSRFYLDLSINPAPFNVQNCYCYHQKCSAECIFKWVCIYIYKKIFWIAVIFLKLARLSYIKSTIITIDMRSAPNASRKLYVPVGFRA